MVLECASVSVVIPVLNEAKTVERLVRAMVCDPLVGEVLVVDDGSIDGTVDIATLAGARVITSSLLGKGASMEDGVREAVGGIVLFLDGDLLDICPDLVARMTAPITRGDADFVKARFSRDAGRVTILTARPLLATFFPEVSAFEQPLGGIVAARRTVLRNLRFENDYGVDVGLLVDAAMRGARLTEIDIGRIDHESQSLEALGRMAKQVTRAILDRAWRHERLSINLVRDMEESERQAQALALPECLNARRRRKFALFDMDGVLLDGRFVAELAKRSKAADDLAWFLDNHALSDTQRTRGIASLFTGVHQDVFEEAARSIPLMQGAVETVIALRRAGYVVGIVTDSFQVAAETVRRRVFADFSVSHMMQFRHRMATGDVVLAPAMLDPRGCPEHECCKSNVVRHLRSTAGLEIARSVAVGDGDNDVCMLRAMGVSVAFRPRSEAVEAAAGYQVWDSLTGVLDILKRRHLLTPPPIRAIVPSFVVDKVAVAASESLG
jgi:glucosyl-3-phosphoglycerate synthase